MNIININENTNNKKLLKTNDNVTIIKNVVINENTTDLLKNNNTNFQKSKEDKYNFDDFSSIFPSMISNFTSNSEDNNSYEWPYSKIPEHDRLKTSLPFEFEYEEVDEESEAEFDEIIEHKNLQYLINDSNDNINCENVGLSNKYKQDSFRNSPKMANNLSTVKQNGKSSQNYEKSPIRNIMNSQSKTEEIIIEMFNNRIKAFPDFQLRSPGKKITQPLNNQLVNSTK